MRDLLADANFLQEAVWKSKDPDKQQVISISLPLCIAVCCIYRQSSYDYLLPCSRHASNVKHFCASCNVCDAETSTNPSRLEGNLRSSAGQCPCTQRVPSQGSGHSSGGPVCTCQKAGQTPGLVRYVTPELLCLLCALLCLASMRGGGTASASVSCCASNGNMISGVSFWFQCSKALRHLANNALYLCYSGLLVFS